MPCRLPLADERTEFASSDPAELRDVIERVDAGYFTSTDIAAADPDHDSVTAIAYRWGFSNPSRFAAACRHAYGVSRAAPCIRTSWP